MATILIIDDDVMLLARLGTLLDEAGYTTLKASELAHAEVLFHDERPDLVLIEVKSDRDAGWDLLERIAGQVPVIVVSAHSREEDVVRGLQAGAIDYVSKPYRSRELLERVSLRLRTAHAASPPPTSAAPSEADIAHEPLVAQAAQSLEAPATVQPSDARSRELQSRRPSTTTPDPVFITETEELALIRSSDGAATEPVEDLDSTLSLGQQLHRERLRRRITLVQAESELHIRMWYLQAMEEEKFSLLPGGPAAANMLHTYAGYLGLNADVMLEEYKRQYYTAPAQPPVSLGSTRTGPLMVSKWKVWVAAIVLALVVSGAAIFFFDPSGAVTLANNVRSLIVAPTATPTPTPTLTPTPTATASPTSTPQPTATRTPVPPPFVPPTPVGTPVPGEPPPPPGPEAPGGPET